MEWLAQMASDNGFSDLLTAPQRRATARRFGLTKQEQRVAVRSGLLRLPIGAFRRA